MKPTKIINNYVYVVLEHHTDTTDEKIHGIYINIEEARGKQEKLVLNSKIPLGYLSVLKKPVLGKEKRPWSEGW